MKKQVTVTKENREFLEKAFKVSSVMIWKALTFESDTDLARRIRKLAVERGGIEMCFCPVLETMHDSDGYMRQYLPKVLCWNSTRMTVMVLCFSREKR